MWYANESNLLLLMTGEESSLASSVDSRLYQFDSLPPKSAQRIILVPPDGSYTSTPHPLCQSSPRLPILRATPLSMAGTFFWPMNPCPLQVHTVQGPEFAVL